MRDVIRAEGVDRIGEFVEGEGGRGLSGNDVVNRGRRRFVRGGVNGEEYMVLEPSDGRHCKLRVSLLMSPIHCWSRFNVP